MENKRTKLFCMSLKKLEKCTKKTNFSFHVSKKKLENYSELDKKILKYFQVLLWQQKLAPKLGKFYKERGLTELKN